MSNKIGNYINEKYQEVIKEKKNINELHKLKLYKSKFEILVDMLKDSKIKTMKEIENFI
jgi:hypothetical protein